MEQPTNLANLDLTRSVQVVRANILVGDFGPVYVENRQTSGLVIGDGNEIIGFCLKRKR